jgi:hypothetical protein
LAARLSNGTQSDLPFLNFNGSKQPRLNIWIALHEFAHHSCGFRLKHQHRAAHGPGCCQQRATEYTAAVIGAQANMSAMRLSNRSSYCAGSRPIMPAENKIGHRRSIKPLTSRGRFLQKQHQDCAQAQSRQSEIEHIANAVSRDDIASHDQRQTATKNLANPDDQARRC